MGKQATRDWSHRLQITGTNHTIIRRSCRDVIGFINEVPAGRIANVVAVPLELPHGNAVGYFATRTITCNEELFVHYGNEYKRDYNCGNESRIPRILENCHDIVDVLRYKHRCIAPRNSDRVDV